MAESRPGARRYQPDVSVFYGVDRLDAGSWAGLAELAGSERGVVLVRDDVRPIVNMWMDPACVAAGLQVEQ